MMFLKRFVSIETLKTTAVRFPAAVICSLTLFVFSVLVNHDVMSFDGAMNARIIAFLICGFFYFIMTRLLAMRCQHIGWLEPVMAVVGAIVLAVCVLMLEGIAVALFVIPVLSAFLLWLGLAPYLRNGDSLSFWFFNRQVWEGALISVLASILFFLGVILALWAIHTLFGADISRKVYGDIWSFAAIVLAPLYALSWIPARFEFAEEDCRAPVQLSFILNWILAPLVMVYMAILYAYFVKLAIVGELPSGQLSYMVTTFGGVGVLTYLAGWPLRETGGPLLRFVIKAFFPALFIPVIVQAISIYLRVDQYGFTESRYMIVLTSLWFAILVGLYTFKKPHLKYIPGILTVFLLVSAVGPMSFVNVAKTSQLNRLEALLLHSDLLVDGQIVKANDPLSLDARREISAKLDFLRDRGHLPMINSWLPADVQVHADVATYNRGGTTRRYSEEHVKAITQAMGFEYMNRYARKRGQDIDAYERVKLRSQNASAGVVPVEGYKAYVSKYTFWNLEDIKAEKEKRWGSSPVVEATYFDDVLTINIEGYGTASINVLDYARDVWKQSQDEKPPYMIAQLSSSDPIRVQVKFLQIEFKHYKPEQEEERYALVRFNFEALIDY